METVLEMRGICKYFPKKRANHNVTFSVRRGEVHALLGENGAGKSTLMNILCGLLQPTSGEIIYKGQPVKNHSTRTAIRMGIGMVHQHFMLIPALSVIENVVLGTDSPKKPFLALDAAAKELKALADRYHMQIEPFQMVRDLSVGQQQRLEILKALYRGAELLILDEPTAVLTPAEVQELFVIIRQLVKDGKTVILITHKLKEVMEISDRITVLSRGEAVATIDRSDATIEELSRLMVGHVIDTRLKRDSLAAGEPVLRVRNISTASEKLGVVAIKNISLDVCKNEIVGICGVDGNGQRELVEAISGHRKLTEGEITIKGRNVAEMSVKDVFDAGVSHIPEDRLKQAVAPSMSLTENSVVISYDKRPHSKHGILNRDAIKRNAEAIIEDYQVKCSGPDDLLQNLSGGNQQKFVVGRELRREPELLLAVHPTRGLDIGATQFIHERMMDCRNSGNAVLVVSTEIDELLDVCDRIMVIYEGRCMGMVTPDIPIMELGMLMAGVNNNEMKSKENCDA